jgi:hypothetical protein
MGGEELEPTGRATRSLRQTVGDMVRSLAVVFAVIGVLLLITWRPQPDPVTVVDIEPVAAVAVQQAEFEPQHITPVLEGYRPTSVRWEPTPTSDGEPVWFIGYVTPNDAYLQIAQSSAQSSAFVDEQTAGGIVRGEAVIDGVTWQEYETPDRRSLVHASDENVLIVSGTDSWDGVRTGAGLLTAVVGGGIGSG